MKQLLSAVPPRLTTEPVNQAIVEGAMATFYCTASGYPNPKITWTKDGKVVVTGDTLSFESNRNHSGKYWCSADNGLNVTVNASALLNVLCKYCNGKSIILCDGCVDVPKFSLFHLAFATVIIAAPLHP